MTAPEFWKDFRRNRLAMVGALVIGFVLAVAVLCPLLANHRPLYFHAVLRGDFENALGICLEQLSLRAEAPTAAERTRADALFQSNLAALAEHLHAEQKALLPSWGAGYRKAVALPQEQQGEALGAIAAEMEALFDAELRAVTRYPALRALGRGEIAALVAAGMLLGLLPWRRRFGGLGRLLLAAAIAGCLAGVVARIAYPSAADQRPYRRLVASEEFRSGAGHVVRTPVPFGENENIVEHSRQAPTWLLPADKRPADWHWLGTDTNGRDVLARMIYGARVSMLLGIVAVALYVAIGMVLGALAGFYRGWTDLAISRLIEVVLCFPPLMLILSVQAFLKPSLTNIILALGALWWTHVALVQRAEFLRLADRDFVMAVRALGGSSFRIIFHHILPNALSPILVMVSFGIAGSILVESGLSFLGFGVPQPMASWGDLLNNGRSDVKGMWWMTVFPGLAIFFTVTCFNLLGEGVRDALDPRRQH